MSRKKPETGATRRALLKGAGCTAAFLSLGGAAQAKSSQASVAYRARPRGGERCANCSYFEPPNA